MILSEELDLTGSPSKISKGHSHFLIFVLLVVFVSVIGKDLNQLSASNICHVLVPVLATSPNSSGCLHYTSLVVGCLSYSAVTYVRNNHNHFRY